MSSAPVLLNKHFKVLSFNGGIAGDDGSSILDVVSGEDFYSKRGEGFDLVLEYTGPEEAFSLTHLAFTAASGTAPIKTVGVWVHPAGGVPDISYSGRFQMEEEAYVQSSGAMRPSPVPTAFFTCKRRGVTAHVIAAPVSGKYIHFRFVNAYAGNNIDIGQIGVVGRVGASAPAAVIEAAAAPSDLKKVNWGAMFSATKKADAAPEVYEMLNFIGALNLPLDTKTVSTPHHAVQVMEMEMPIYILASKISVYDALLAHRAGSATADQTTVAHYYEALQVAAQTKGRKFIMFIDPVTEATYELAHLAKVFAHVPEGSDRAVLEFPVGVEGPVLLVGCHGSDDVYAFHEQQMSELTAAGVAARGKASKKDLAEKLKGLSISGFSQSDAVVGFIASKTDNLKAFVASAVAPANDVHPKIPSVKVVTAGSFERLVLDSANPVLMVLDTENWDASNERVYALAQVFARNNIAIDVVAGRPECNTFDRDFVDDQATGVAALLFVKTDGTPAPSATKGISFKLESGKVAVPGSVTAKNASGKTVKMFSMAMKKATEEKDEDKDEDEDEDEDEDHEADERYVNPSPKDILDFVQEAGVEVLITPDIQKDLETVKKFCGLSPNALKELLTFVSNVRIGPSQKYALRTGTKAATETAPFFEWASLVTEHAITKGATDGATMWENIEAVARIYPAAIEGPGRNISAYASRVVQARDLTKVAMDSVNKFRSQLAAELVSEVEAAARAVSDIIGVAAPRGLKPADLKAWVDAESAEEQTPVDMEEVEAKGLKLAEVYTRAGLVFTTLDTEARSSTGYDDVAPELVEPDQFIRVATGLPPVPKPRARTTKPGAKPKPEVPVENAQQRIVVLLRTMPGLSNKEDYAEYAKIFKTLADKAAAEGTEPQSVLYTVQTNMLEQLSGSLAMPMDAMPGALFFQNGELIETKTNVTPEGLREFVELTVGEPEFEDMPGYGAGEEGEFEGFGDEDEEDAE
jgi:hypothetical protein